MYVLSNKTQGKNGTSELKLTKCKSLKSKMAKRLTILPSYHFAFALSHQDSNLGQELQKLWCCRYTMGQGGCGFGCGFECENGCGCGCGCEKGCGCGTA